MTKHRLTAAAVLSLALIAGQAAADPATPHLTAAQVDCLWAGAPESFRQSLTGTLNEADFEHQVDSWEPTDALLSAMADGCHIAGDADHPAGETAAFALIARTTATWAQARLGTAYKVAPERLDLGWRQVAADTRTAFAQYIRGGASGDVPSGVMGAVAKFAAALGLTDQDGVKTVSMYLYGRAMMEQLETPAS
jgi:hypothetical protein